MVAGLLSLLSLEENSFLFLLQFLEVPIFLGSRPSSTIFKDCNIASLQSFFCSLISDSGEMSSALKGAYDQIISPLRAVNITSAKGFLLCKVTSIGSTDENLGIFCGPFSAYHRWPNQKYFDQHSNGHPPLRQPGRSLWREPGRVSLSEQFMVSSLMATSVTTNSTTNACQETPAVSEFCSAGRNKTGQIDLAALT